MTAVALLLLGIALLVYRDADPPARPVLVDPVQGSVDGVRLGDTRQQVEAKLGDAPAWSDDQSMAPLEEDWADIGAPSSLQMTGKPYALRYPHTSVTLEDGRVVEVVTAERGATTPAGIGVGAELEALLQAYPSLRCRDASAAGGHGSYPACAGRLAQGRWLWFGQDPIRSISLASKGQG